MALEAGEDRAQPGEHVESGNDVSADASYEVDMGFGEDEPSADEGGEAAADEGADASEGEGDESRASSPASGEGDDAGSAAESSPSSSIPREVLDRLERAERRANDLEAKLSGALRDPAKAAVSDQPPKPRDKLQTVDDMIEYMRWERARDEQAFQAQVALDAARVASEQRARGELSVTNMGDGNDYDSMVSRHVADLEAANPDLRRMFDASKDPAVARYTFAFIREMSERFGGNPAKTFNEIRNSMKARAKGEEDIVKKIDEAAKKGAAQLRGKVTRPSKTPTKKLDVDTINSMSDDEYRAWERRIYGN